MLRTDDLYFVKRLRLSFNKFSAEIAAVLMFCYNFFFLLAKLALNDFLHQIDGYIHVIAYLL